MILYRNTIIIAGLLIITFGIAVAKAENSVYFKAPLSFAGTGCPASSISVTGEESATLTVLFDSYDAADPPSEAVSELQRSSCNFAVPVHVPAGWQVSLMTADWRGYAAGEAEFQREYFFADQASGMKIVKTFDDPDGIDYTERDSLEPGDYTVCQPEDRDVVLRINSDILAKSIDSYIAVDTGDMHNKVVFRLNSKTCRREWLPIISLLLLQNSL
ncbi:MAG: DUF4360 domain-containing protein [Candidatus Electrothrix sp. AX5]|nr:DUF4360 domain-containing protein [Candidatus Electrothrix sp. AX5]